MTILIENIFNPSWKLETLISRQDITKMFWEISWSENLYSKKSARARPYYMWNRYSRVAVISAKKPQAPTPQAPIRNRQTRKVANAKGLNRNTNLT